MGKLPAREREEIALYRDRIAARMEELEDAVTYGILADEEKHRLLEQEFGADYGDALASCNALLHHSARTARPHAHTHMFIVAGFILLSALIVGLLVSPGPLAGKMVFIESAGIEEHLLLPGKAVTLSPQGPIVISTIDITYVGSDMFTLSLQDGRGTHDLVTGFAGAHECVGCGKTFLPPYEIQLMPSTGFVTIHSLVLSPA